MPYVIRFVADMTSATRFFRDDLGLTLRFESPDWTEFDTGSTTLALHPATAGGGLARASSASPSTISLRSMCA